jgi:hypothetical protein
VATVVVGVVSEDHGSQAAQKLRISQQTAEKLGLVTLDDDGNEP